MGETTGCGAVVIGVTATDTTGWVEVCTAGTAALAELPPIYWYATYPAEAKKTKNDKRNFFIDILSINTKAAGKTLR